MEPIPAFALTVGATTALAAVVSLALLRSLSPLLTELCGTAARARFWATFTACSTLSTVLFASLLAAPELGRGGAQSIAVFDVVVASARFGVLGLLFALGTLGFALLLAIGRYESLKRAPRPLGLEP